MSLLNMANAYQRVVRGVQQHAPEQVPEGDWKVWQMFSDLAKVKQ